MNYPVTFFLGFLDEEHAFWLLVHLIENILPPNFYGRSKWGRDLEGLEMEKHIITRLFVQFFPEEEITDFLDMYGPMFMIPLFVNFVSFETSINFFDHLFKTNSVSFPFVDLFGE